MRRLLATTCISSVFLCAALAFGLVPAQAQYLSPHVTAETGPQTATVDGRTFTNFGLVAVGRVEAGMRDRLGDTLGSFSGMAVDPASWRRDGDSFVLRIRTLPDRGYNDPDTQYFSDYPARIEAFDARLRPGAAVDSLSLTYAGALELKDDQGRPTGGTDPGAAVGTRLGRPVPVVPAADGGDKLTIDAEAIALRTDGSFYVSDEYGPGIYLFGADGILKGVLPTPAALLPQTPAGTPNFNSLKPPVTGRRNNQGFEGLTITPDGTRLVALLQSGTIQDAREDDQSARSHTRLLVYDISGDPLPAAPIAHHVVRLPTFKQKGDGTGAPDRTAAASEILALDASTFLVLARDGIGRGDDGKNAIMVKTIQVVSIAGATNLAGTPYETTTQPVAPKGVLDPAITPATSTDLVNLLNSAQLASFGLNLDARNADGRTLSEKWESLALLPALDPARPDDFFLLVGNDNDFKTRNGMMQGKPYDAGMENDSLVLAYRLSLPGVKLPAFASR